MDNAIVLTATEIFQLAAIGPCIVIIFYLALTTNSIKLIFIPLSYFTCLLGTLLLPILSIFPELDIRDVRNTLLFIEHLEPILAFLLVVQFLLQKLPQWKYWLILCVPFVGGGALFQLHITGQTACLLPDACIPPEDLMAIYRAITTATIFLLLVPLLSKRAKTSRRGKDWTHQYWLIIMLTLYNLFIMIVDLLRLAQIIDEDQALFIQTMLSVTFIYLALSSVFRVFNKSLHLQSIKEIMFTSRDKDLVKKIDHIIHDESPYRDLQFNRGALADQLGLSEQHLSRIINTHYKKSFSELMNEHRVNDACELLTHKDTSITEISFDVGFRSITSFNRVFKEAMGISPSKYRAREKRLNAAPEIN